MGREKKIEMGAINITIHPHSPRKYVELFKKVKKLKSIQHIHSDKYGLLTTVMYLDKEEGETSPLTGDLRRFTNINVEGQWFNTKTSDNAEKNDLEKINIPNNLKPNSSRFSYIFFPKEHIMFYECYYDGHTLGPNNAVTLMDKLFNDSQLADEFGKVEVTHIPCIDELSKALGMHRLESLELLISRPNPDDQSDAERRVLRRMNEMHVAEQTQQYKAIPGQSITIDQDLKILANIAAKNGEVTAKGKDDLSKPQIYATSRHPWKDKFYYNSSVDSPFDLFVMKAKSAKDELLSWFQKI